ncbi:GAF domain-containing protein [Streptomyces sp. ZYX-F-203]
MASSPPGSRRPEEEEGVSSELRERVPKLLTAMRSVGSGLELRTTLERICETAATLAEARYAAIGVLTEDGEGLEDFVRYGVDAAGGGLPGGRKGLLGALLDDPGPVRLADLTTDPREGGLPPDHAPMRGFLAVPIRVHGEAFGNLYLAEKLGGTGFEANDLHVVRVLATEAGMAIGNARLYEAARQHERWIDGALAVTRALRGEGDLVDALRIVAEQARRLSDSDAGIVVLFLDDRLEVAAADPPEATGILDTGVARECETFVPLLDGRAVHLDDLATDALACVDVAAKCRFGPTAMLPLCVDERVLGALVLPRARGGRPFTPSERVSAAQFAEQAALALALAEAERDRERLAVYAERQRVARDLHELVIEQLLATGTMLTDAQRRTTVPEVRDGVRRAVEELGVTIDEIRSAVFALRQPAERSPGLSVRVLREITTAAVALGFTPSYRRLGPVDDAIGDLTGRNLIAALRETLSNAFRHSRATRIEIVLDATVTLPGGVPGVRLTVADDGVGIPEDRRRRSGLRNLQRRAESLGGAERIEPGLGPGGRGTTVVWEAPY